MPINSARISLLLLLCTWTLCSPTWALPRRSGAQSSKRIYPSPEALGGLFDGDILNPPPKPSSWHFDLCVNCGNKDPRWKDGIVPIKIDDTKFNDTHKHLIFEAMDDIMLKTCVEFRLATAEDPNFLFITNNSVGCASEFIGVAETKTGQSIHLNHKQCFDGSGTIVHELMHVLGFSHEHSRQDRNQYIKIREDLEQKLQFQFEQKETANLTLYDFRSILHYTQCNEPTGCTKPEEYSFQLLENVTKPSFKIGQRLGLSVLDAVKINRAYCPWYKPVTQEFIEKYAKEGGPVGLEWEWEEQQY